MTAERNAFVTGAASGLGEAIAKRLSTDGFRVAIADIDSSGGERVAKELGLDQGRATFVECDVADLAAVRSAADTAERELGPIDALVHNAGFDEPNFFLQTDPGSWNRLLEVNLVGVLNCIYEFAPRIARRTGETGYGRIVNIASDAGRVGALGEAVYSAAKGGVIAFTKSMARELARDRVTVNAVCPGPAETPMTEEIRRTDIGKMMTERIVRNTPLRRLAEPDDVAGAVAYFLRDDARFITGQALSVSGGLTMHG
jgi:2-hydroxycyclohexanecarboxyl-CoA dehydrogenase